MSYRVVFAKQAQKDALAIGRTKLRENATARIAILREDPFRSPPPFEALVGELAGAYSRRINIHHRLVYQVLEAEKTVKVLRMWTHYGE